MVPIQIKMGSNGKIVYPGLQDLQNQTRAVNVDFTWIQAFRTHFGVSVDPERYSIRRHLAVRHHLREQVCNFHLFPFLFTNLCFFAR